MLPLVIIAVLGFFLRGCNSSKEETQRQYDNLVVYVDGAKESLVRDTLHASKTVAQKLYREELAAPSTSLIKDAGDRVTDVESLSTSASSIRDTIFVGDSLCGTFRYKDSWVTIDVRDSLLSYEVRDSLTTIVTTDYKHRFLWWKWGKRGYRVTVVSHNPHSRITYNDYITVLH